MPAGSPRERVPLALGTLPSPMSICLTCLLISAAEAEESDDTATATNMMIAFTS